MDISRNNSKLHVTAGERHPAEVLKEMSTAAGQRKSAIAQKIKLNDTKKLMPPFGQEPSDDERRENVMNTGGVSDFF